MGRTRGPHPSRYDYLTGCDFPECKAANAAYVRKLRRRKRNGEPVQAYYRDRPGEQR